jgi:hypothetical protein
MIKKIQVHVGLLYVQRVDAYQPCENLYPSIRSAKLNPPLYNMNCSFQFLLVMLVQASAFIGESLYSGTTLSS